MSDKPFGRNPEDVPDVIVPSAERLARARRRFEEAERARAAVPVEDRILDENPKFNKGFGPVSPNNEIRRGEVQEYYRRMGYDPYTGEKLPDQLSASAFDVVGNVARLFAGIDESGVPFMVAARLHVDDLAERSRVHDLLRDGKLILCTTDRAVYQLDTSRGMGGSLIVSNRRALGLRG